MFFRIDFIFTVAKNVNVIIRLKINCSFSEIIEKVKRPPPLIRPSVSKGAAPPEAINIMRQCWAEQAEMRPDFNAVHDLFKKLNHGRYVFCLTQLI